MSTTTFTASTLVTPYYSSKSRYTTDAAVQGARWRNSSSQQMVGLLGIPSLANVTWTAKVIDSVSLTVTTRSLTEYDTIRLYGSAYNTYYSSSQIYGYQYLDTDGGYTDISIGTTETGEQTVSLTDSNIEWLLDTLRDGKTYFCMYYEGDTATSTDTYSEHSYGCTAFALTITYSDAKSEIDSITDAEIESTTTLSWTNYASSSRTCKVRFILGDTDSGYITASGSSYTYTLPTTWYDELSSSTSGTATAYLYTYINDTLIGTDTTTFTASVSSSIVPSIGSITATKYNSNETVDSWDVWLQNYTQAVIAVSGCAAGDGATISSYAFSGQNLSSTVSSAETSASATSSTIQVSGDLMYSVKITDSRGRTATSTVDITVEAYAAPNISAASGVRCDSDGTVNTATGEYGKAAIKYTYTSVGSNTMTNTLSYKLHSDSVYTTIQTDIASWTYSSVFGTLDVASVYDVQGYIEDSLGNSSTYVTQISSVSGISFGLYNDRARFGGVCQQEGLQIDWITEIDNNLNIVTDNYYPFKITDADGNLAYRLLNYNGTSQASYYDVGVERNYIGDGRFSAYDSTGTEVDRVSASGSFFGSDVNHTGALTVNGNPVVLTVNNTAPDSNGNVDVSGGSTTHTLYSADGTVDLETRSTTEIAELTLSAGTYIVYCSMKFASNTTGRRIGVVSYSANSASPVSEPLSDRRAPVDGAVTHCKMFDIITFDSQVTLYLNAYQNSGSTLSTYGIINAYSM